MLPAWLWCLFMLAGHAALGQASQPADLLVLPPIWRTLPTLQGAVRGLSEELGISATAAQLAGPLAPTHRRELHQGDFHDVELVQSYRWVGGGRVAWWGVSGLGALVALWERR